METTKLERLKTLRITLIDCMTESVEDADEWQIYDEMLKRIKNLITEEQHRQGYMAVYTIVDGNARDVIYTGTKESCELYVDILLTGNPEMKGNVIIANI